MKRLSALALPVAALTLAACGSSSSSSTPSSSSSPATTSAPAATSTPAGNTIAVTMQNIAFNPAALHAKVGQTIVWTNKDSVSHNVTYVSGPKFTSSSTFGSGGTYSIKLSQAGLIHYRCTIHPQMLATIVVAP